MPEDLGRACDLFTLVHIRAKRHEAWFESILNVCRSGVELARTPVGMENIAVTMALFQEWADAGILKNLAWRNDYEAQRKFAEAWTTKQIDRSQAFIDAFALVFAHSLLDVAVNDLLEITTLTDHSSWCERVAGRKVTIEAIRKNSCENLEKEMIRTALEDLKKESVLKKADTLYSICKPNPAFVGVKEFRYSRETIGELDSLRHDVVHKVRIENPIDGIKEKLSYLQSTAMHLIMMVRESYDLKIDPTKLIGYLAAY